MADVLRAALPSLLSPDAATRQAAEAAIQAAKADPNSYIPALAQAAASFEQPEMKQMSIVLLKRASSVVADALWPQCGAQAQEQTKDALLGLLSGGHPSRVLSTLTDAIATVALAVSNAGGQWDKLLPSVFGSITSQDNNVKVAGYTLLADLAQTLPAASLEAFLPHIPAVFAQAMSAQSPHNVRIVAVKAACGLVVQQVQEKGGEKKVEGLMGMVDGLLEVLSACVAAGDTQGARDTLSSIIDLADGHPGFFRSSAQAVLSAAMTLCRNKALDEGVRFTAMELLIVYAERKPTQFRKVQGALDGTLSTLFESIDAINEDEEWNDNQADREECDEEQEEVEMAEGALERLLCAVGGAKAVQPVLSLAQQRLQSPKWQHRYSALRAVGILASCASDALNEQLVSVLKTVLAYCTDSHPRVVWACLGALAALLSCYGPEVQAKHHALVIPVLAPLLNAGAHPRLRSRATKCIVDFMAECTDDEAEMVDGYADGLLTVLTDMVVNGSTAHKLCAVSAISAVAVALQERFTRFYAHLMPGFMGVLSNIELRDRDARELRGKAMECVSCIADAVGNDVFGKDAPAVMELLMLGHKGAIDAEDPQVTYLLQAAARIAKCMKSSFVPYMQYLLPPILAFAQLDPKLDFQLDDGSGDGEESSVVDIKGMGKMRVSINVKELEDKALGCASLSALAEALMEHFLPFMEHAAAILVPAVTYKLSQDVRITAVESMPDLLKALKAAVDKGMAPAESLRVMWSKAFTQLMQAAIVEPEMESQATILESISASIEACGAGCLDDEQQLQLCQVIEPIVNDHITNNGKDEADEDEEDDTEDREEVLRESVEVLCAALKTHGAAVVPKIQSTVLPLFGRLLVDKRPPEDKSCALNVLVDLVEHGAEAAVPLVPNVAAACLQYAADSNCHIRRSACFGIAVCAQRGGETFSGTVPTALQTMHAVATAAGGREGENKEAFDNAADAIARMCKYQASSLDVSQVVPVLVSWLPLQDDLECAESVHSYLADLLEQNQPVVLPALPHAVRAVAMVLSSDKKLANDETKARLSRALSAIPKATLQEACLTLEPALRAVIQL